VFTQCPDCGTVFRVTATVLRAARGQVRCGVCDATFDALQYLTEEADTEPDAGGAPAPPLSNQTPDAAADPSFADEESDDADEFHDESHDESEDEDEPFELSDAETEERILDAAYGGADVRRDREFPLEELDDPIDVIASPGSGPAPEFPPFALEEDAEQAEQAGDAEDDTARTRSTFARSDDDTARTRSTIAHADDDTARTRSTVAREDEQRRYGDDDDVDVEFEAESETLTSGAAAPLRIDADTAPVERFERRAGRNTPSADEDRALAEIAAALARRAQAAPAIGGAAGADDDAPPLEIDLLDASAAENIVLSGGEDVPDSALEFNLPVEDWDQVFVPDEGAATIPPLDPTLALAQRDALQDHAEPNSGVAHAVVTEDDIEIDLDPDDDGDLDEGERRDRVAATERAAVTPTPSTREPSLSRTDEFPPLRVTPAEEATAGPTGTQNAKPRTGVFPDEFDALVAAAAARAAADVAARVGTAGAAAGSTAATERVTASAAAASATVAPASSTTFRDPLSEALDGTAENAWFSARRDLAPESPAGSEPESPETIQFDAQRFQAIARGRRRRPWWLTAAYALGTLVLALALGVQSVHYWRESLAQSPLFGAPLREIYARFGIPLEPKWNLGAFDVKQWGATSDVAPGTLRVRASIVNRAPRAQPHPLLRVTLLDRFSAKVARREFAPAEYLPGRTAPTDMLAAGARVDADLVIADPGSDAVGFELDVCLKRRGVLECAGDAKLAAP
jgi:predicted Zn finger-like uncharacterized protein